MTIKLDESKVNEMLKDIRTKYPDDETAQILGIASAAIQQLLRFASFTNKIGLHDELWKAMGYKEAQVASLLSVAGTFAITSPTEIKTIDQFIELLKTQIEEFAKLQAADSMEA